MQKTLLTTTLAIIGSFVIGSSALAAPSVVYKKRLDVPTVPTTVINKVKASSWRYTTDKGTRYKPEFANFTNVAVKTPTLVNEKGCSDVIYRIWSIDLDIGAMRKTHPNLVPYSYSFDGYYLEDMEPGKYVIEARTPTAVKWQVEPKTDASYYQGLFMGCKDKNLIIENSYSGKTAFTDGNGRTEIRTIPYISFTNDNAWKAKPIEQSHQSQFSRVTVDGILQSPGKITVYSSANVVTEIVGDSRVTTFEDEGGVHVHGLPRYRDLSAMAMRDKETLTATFYRMKDGYAVAERSNYNEGTMRKSEMNYYRIRNGEAQYSRVDSLPFNGQTSFETYDKGLEIVLRSNIQVGGLENTYKRGLVHGLNAGHNIPEAIYDVKTTILWETDSQVYMRYLITDKHTKKQQYWEATVSKN
jgi:hypothetical protein